MAATPAEQPPPPLMPLRQDLTILRDKGRERWLLHDPIRGKYHTLGPLAFTAISRWAETRPDEFVTLLNQTDPTLNFTLEDLKALSEFLMREKLFDLGGAQDTEKIAAQEAFARKPWHEQIIHKYLFIRIPIWNPQSFLDRHGPSVSKWLRPALFKTIALIGIIGLFFAARQWDDFVSTFLYFFTFQGFLFYALTLIIIKILHELGHAFTARHFGARVPIIGLAFLVMFPILYTDTTDAWRVSDRRSRLLINAGGMIVELSIAAISLFAWALLPDGIWRSAAFFAATTSWTLSLIVNLNPWMRFDGYYIASDFFRIENLQARGFAIGRWVMRKTLWGLDEGIPEPLSKRGVAGLTLYAWSTWIYRFFLFLGIAILIHHIFPKAIGIVLFVIEIAMFIALPIWRELKHWWSARMTIISNSRGRLGLLSGAVALGLFITPWQTTVSAPAVIRPSETTQIFSPQNATLAELHIENGQTVQQGDLLLSLTSPLLSHRREIAALDLKVAQARWDQQAASLQDRQLRDILADELATKREALAAIERELSRLNIVAPHDGIVSDLPRELAVGTHLQVTQALMRVSDSRAVELIALPSEQHARRLDWGADFTFISDRLNVPRREGRIAKLAPTSETYLTEPVLTVVGGGPIAVSEDAQGRAVADIPVFKATGLIPGERLLREERGVVKIAATPQSPAQAVWNRTAGILLRETDF